ncbi:riboflavin synthase subunit alpha [Acinetobacter guillouiae]|jgi:riboflavin synthase|uniref:riboflavin synthase subunit alpha n=1 Tax=Acinetobacter TaxID=469 RepID=UPI00141A9822|nr:MULTISPECIES: riboflavin synthase subunit alpha [Acinetobacter]MDN5418919.1 riboflavin synthase subunit alpha [Acinetobacter sp.]MCS4299444.1 riboflavin synthase [Acinetobacter guillouiae]MCW2252712.1 riboflavin synthase [Acinetobacter sp. BIGb0204]MDN5434882.1 riboflavin synthase subunit alpha [Acinetobacter sp.]MDN5625455.1 riboflavin synthase subunit alpha [Acinetobacter sp.]
MYTGIVQGLEKVVNIQQGDNFTTLYISNENGFLNDVFIGASVAIDGTCLTATSFDTIANIASFDVSALTTSLTTLQFLKIGDEVNIERSIKAGMENGGHNIFGHIEGMATIKDVVHTGETLHIDIVIPDDNIKYFFKKGFIGLQGCSLTVNRVDRKTNEISVDLIPETLRLTTFKHVQIGGKLNYEIDQMTRTMVDTLESIHQRQQED